MATPEQQRLLRALNPWLADPAQRGAAAAARVPAGFIHRRAGAALRAALDRPERAHLVIGPRQAGKSTLIWWALQGERPLVYLNCEEPLVRSWCASPALLAADLADFLPPGGVLFLEEAQWLDEAGLLVKGLVDAQRGWTILVTGSSSFHLLARTRESLAGRATRHTLFPLDLAEVAPPDPLPGPTRLRRAPVVDQLLRFGGYPGAWTAGDARADVLAELKEAFVLRDASDRFKIERPDAFRRLMQLMALQVGDLVNLAEWASLLGVAGTTVAQYLTILEERHVVRAIRPFVGGKRAELTKTPKLFFVDNGLRNAVAGGFGELPLRPDRGKLVENYVFSELHKRWPMPGQVRYWRSKNGAEVDFVLEPQPGRLVALEVKASARAKLSRSARGFIQAYAPAELWLVHQGEPAQAVEGDTQIRWVPLVDLPEALSALGAEG